MQVENGFTDQVLTNGNVNWICLKHDAFLPNLPFYTESVIWYDVRNMTTVHFPQGMEGEEADLKTHLLGSLVINGLRLQLQKQKPLKIWRSFDEFP